MGKVGAEMDKKNGLARAVRPCRIGRADDQNPASIIRRRPCGPALGQLCQISAHRSALLK